MPRLKNPNHEKFAKNYAKAFIDNNGKVSNTKVYAETYDCQLNSASAAAPRLLGNDSVQNRIREIIESKNPPELVAERLNELQQANKEIFDPEGNLIEVKDNSTRVAAVGLALKALGAFQEGNANIDARSINIVSDSGSNMKFDTIIERLDKMNQKLLNEEI